MKRDGGLDILPDGDKEACGSFFDLLADYGVFVVPVGEIEAWLPGLEVSRNKNTWLTSIFQAMGEDPVSQNYIQPSSGDVWDFVGEVCRWVANPSRRGIPD
jgi:hypothetical protein